MLRFTRSARYSTLIFIVMSVVVVSGMSAGCEPSTIVTTNVTLPTSPTSVFTQPTTSGGCTTSANCTSNPSPNQPGQNTTRPPEIFRFDSDSYQIVKYGSGTTLRWEILDPNATVRIDPYPGSVGIIGFLPVFPQQTTTYTLTARNSIGAVSRAVTIFVISPS